MATLVKRRRANGSIAYRVQDRTTGYPSLSKSFSTLKAAREYRRKIEADRQAGMAGIRRGRQTLRECADAFMATPDFQTRKSISDARRQIEWWCERMGQLPLSAVTPDLVASYLHTLEVSGLSGSTVNSYRAMLARLYRFAIRTRRWLDTSPVATVERRPEGKRRERVITTDEWDRLLTAAGNLSAGMGTYSAKSQLANFLRVAYGTAARKSDVTHLRWEFVDLEAKQATFHDTKSGESHTVPLVGDALKAVKAQAKIRREGCPWVFPAVRSNANPPRFDNAWVAVRAAARVDGLDVRGERLVIHSLRHSAATEAGLGGATAFEVAALTGHKSLANVQRYTHTGPANALAALKKRARV